MWGDEWALNILKKSSSSARMRKLFWFLSWSVREQTQDRILTRQKSQNITFISEGTTLQSIMFFVEFLLPIRRKICVLLQQFYWKKRRRFTLCLVLLYNDCILRGCKMKMFQIDAVVFSKNVWNISFGRLGTRRMKVSRAKMNSARDCS